MLDPYLKYSDGKRLRISLGKTLTHKALEDVLRSHFSESMHQSAIDFDLTRVEWVSLLELLLLIQWVHRLTCLQKKVRVFLPYTASLLEEDGIIQETVRETTPLEPMRRRRRVDSFLQRLGFSDELSRIIGHSPIHFGDDYSTGGAATEPHFSDRSDPIEARILRITSFTDRSGLDLDIELSNEQLRRLLKEHSCLDPIDSGMLAEVVIEELASNALVHGINVDDQTSMHRVDCAWVSARLVKSSSHSLQEVPEWLAPLYSSLLGRHYVEVTVCDSGEGIYSRLKDHVPSWLSERAISVKAVLDYAFDKYSSSLSRFRSELDRLPRGLFWVYDLVSQYGGLLLVRSNGYFMAYDFLSRRSKPRILELSDTEGACTDTGGTAVQIVLPESRGLFVKAYPTESRPPLEKPHIFTVHPPPPNIAVIEYAKQHAIELEQLCQRTQMIPIFVDFTELDTTNAEEMHLLARMVRYVIYFENPNILWLLGPGECQPIHDLHQFLTTGECVNQQDKVLPVDVLHSIFGDIGQHDRRICPMLLPSGTIVWLGATQDETLYLKHLWDQPTASLDEFEDESQDVLQFALANKNLISVNRPMPSSTSPTIALRLGLLECISGLPSVLDQSAEHLIREIPGTINTEGCYHLPRGEYSDTYIYMKPLLMNPKYARRIARYLLCKTHLANKLSTIDILAGGTHAAKRLILVIAEELGTDYLTIDRYVDQLDEPMVAEIVADKRALIVTDVISSGTFVKKVARRIIEAGGRIQAICCVADLRPAPSKDLDEISVISLFRHPLRKFPRPDTTQPMYEVNPISLRPMNLEEERTRGFVPSIMTTDQLIRVVNDSNALIPAHIVLGPTHYTYFVNTKAILDTHAEEFYRTVEKDITDQLATFGMRDDDLVFLVTAEGSNAELVFPVMIRNRFPGIRWVQVDRVRLFKDGTWQLDRLDKRSVPVQEITNKAVLLWDDGSNTGGTMMQLLDIVSEFQPTVILAYCLVNRLSTIRSHFLSQITRVSARSNTVVKFVAHIPISTFVRSSCPICNRAIPRIPPIKDLLDYWAVVKRMNEPQNWNHISARRIPESARSRLRTRLDGDDHLLLSEAFRVRCLFGRFEDRVGVGLQDREELRGLLSDELTIGSICFILNREPQLLESIVNFQVPDFETQLIDAILERVQERESSKFIARTDVIEFIATKNPHTLIDNLDVFLGDLIRTENDCIALVARLTCSGDTSGQLEILQNLSTRICARQESGSLGQYLRGLCGQCVSWLNMEMAQEASTDVLKAIIDLRDFYSPKRHGGASEYAAPLDHIIELIGLLQKLDQPVPDRSLLDDVCREWRDITGHYFENKLKPCIMTSKHILRPELTSEKAYYFFSSTENFMTDHLAIERWLSVLEARNANRGVLFSATSAEDLVRSIRRLYEGVFDAATSPIAKVVQTIPADVAALIRQCASLTIPECELDIRSGSGPFNAFMTRQQMERVLDEILRNTRRHNFGLPEKGPNETAAVRKEWRIHVVIESRESRIHVLIRSNGPHLYNDGESQGIRMIREVCQRFNASYEICNRHEWVENTLILERY